MADLLATGAVWLAGQLKANVSRLVRITRGTEEIEIYATIGETAWEIDRGDGLTTEHSDRDFIVTAVDYQFGGIVVTPANGDLVTDTADPAGGESTFEVMAPAGQQAYRYERSGTLLRVHTKRITLEN